MNTHSTTRVVWLVLLLQATLLRAESVLNSAHNLSVSGPGAIKAATEADACVFCHTSHGAAPKSPLWNHTSSGATYTPYNSTTIKAVVGQPTGASKLCLSCHDGTVALGSLRGSSTTIKMQNNVTMLPSGKSNLGTDLSGDHPISIVYDANLAASDSGLKNPVILTTKVRLDSNKELQCTSCHDPHDNQFGNFLVQNNYGSALCLNCHNVTDWSASIHNTSPAVWNGQGQNPWPNTSLKSVAANACESCHANHNAGTKPRLLTAVSQEQSCYVCHSGTVAQKNIRSEFNKWSVHPVELTANLHDAAEDVMNSPRHVSCADCHNPHASKSQADTSSTLSGALAGVKGINSTGAVVNPLNKEFELCFRCHADSHNKGPGLVIRQNPQTNKRLQFNPSNASFHPVESAGKSSFVPSLISPLTTASVLNCTDCHNNDQGPGAGGTGPRGPHGSAYAPLLERQQVLTDMSPESAASFALCYKCHSRASILANQSFPGHSRHILNYQTACTTCHDSHGVASNPNLINFNAAYVTPAPNAGLSYTSAGRGRDNCTLSCHGSIHINRSYDGAAPLRKRSLTAAAAGF